MYEEITVWVLKDKKGDLKEIFLSKEKAIMGKSAENFFNGRGHTVTESTLLIPKESA